MCIDYTHMHVQEKYTHECMYAERQARRPGQIRVPQQGCGE